MDRESTLSARASSRGWRLEKADAGYRLVTLTGTFVAAKWTEPDGFGLTLDEIEAALNG